MNETRDPELECSLWLAALDSMKYENTKPTEQKRAHPFFGAWFDSLNGGHRFLDAMTTEDAATGLVAAIKKYLQCEEPGICHSCREDLEDSLGDL